MSTIGLETDPRGLEGQTERRMDMLTELLREASHQNFDDFVESWMRQLPENTRKEWAYMGSIFSREEDDPVEDFEAKTFCPGNWCYAIALAMLCPRLLGRFGDAAPHGTEDWTVTTRGVICKGILGVNFLRLGAAPWEDTPAVGALPRSLGEKVPTNAKYLEKIAYVTHRIASETRTWDGSNLKEAWRRSRTAEARDDPRDPEDSTPQRCEREAPPPRRRGRGDDDPAGNVGNRWTGEEERSGTAESPEEEVERWEETLTLLVVGAVTLERDPTLRKNPRIRNMVEAVTRSLSGERPCGRGLLEAVAATNTGSYWEARPGSETPGERGGRETNWKAQGGSEWMTRPHWAGGEWGKARWVYGQAGYSRGSRSGWYDTPTSANW